MSRMISVVAVADASFRQGSSAYGGKAHSFWEICTKSLDQYQNPLLCKPCSGKSPVFLGPAFIHMQRRFEDYYTFFAGVLKLDPQLQCLNMYGTD